MKFIFMYCCEIGEYEGYTCDEHRDVEESLDKNNKAYRLQQFLISEYGKNKALELTDFLHKNKKL